MAAMSRASGSSTKMVSTSLLLDVAKVRVNADERMTVRDDTGIRIAASSGPTRPAIASAEAPAL